MTVIPKLYWRIVNCSEIILKLGQNYRKQCTRDFSLTREYFKNNQNTNWGSKKAHRNVKVQSLLIQEMADPKIEEILAPLRAAVKEQVS
jgi:tRNA U34 2-thiouridine synthase MnmA/TrmU